MGEVMAGSNKPLIVTSGVAGLTPGRLATENDLPQGEHLPRVSEQTGLAFASRGVRAISMRLPQVHGGDGRAGLITYLLETARQEGVSAYVGDGSNRWSAAHRLDVARLYRLALEKGRAGARYHAVADEGVPMREIAGILGRALGVPTVSIGPEEAAAHFGTMGWFAGLDMQASSAITQAELGWKPTHPGLIADIGQPGYFD
jgi:nucleoside-diphosphate-sugar epimerase